jgi:hypothetical protein
MSHIIENVTIQYNHLIEPSTDWEPHKYSVTLGPLTDDQVAFLEDLGLGHRINYEKENMAPCINISQKVTNPKTGAINRVPIFKAADGETDFLENLGHGSKANVMFATYTSGFNQKQESILEGVQVVTLVEGEKPLKFGAVG